jgi:hypothetical protein
MKVFVQTFFLVFMSLTVYSQDIDGDWGGTLKVPGAQFRIIFHIAKKGQTYIATMDSPDQNVNGIPITFTSFRDPDVKFEISNLGIV